MIFFSAYRSISTEWLVSFTVTSSRYCVHVIIIGLPLKKKKYPEMKRQQDESFLSLSQMVFIANNDGHNTIATESYHLHCTSLIHNHIHVKNGPALLYFRIISSVKTMKLCLSVRPYVGWSVYFLLAV